MSSVFLKPRPGSVGQPVCSLRGEIQGKKSTWNVPSGNHTNISTQNASLCSNSVCICDFIDASLCFRTNMQYLKHKMLMLMPCKPAPDELWKPHGCLITSAFGPARPVFLLLLLTTPSEHPVPAGVSYIPQHTSYPAGPQPEQGDTVIRAHTLPPLPPPQQGFYSHLHPSPLSPLLSTSLCPPTPPTSLKYCLGFFQPATLTPAGQRR